MAEAKHGHTVKVHYTGRLEDGSVFDTSANREPLEFDLGSGQVIPGFENGIVGMNVGDSKTINIPADQAYGLHHKELEIVVDRGEFPPDMEPEVGDQLQVTQPNGQVAIVTVTSINDTSVTLDANHPLAGKNLIFDVDLVEIS